LIPRFHIFKKFFSKVYLDFEKLKIIISSWDCTKKNQNYILKVKADYLKGQQEGDLPMK